MRSTETAHLPPPSPGGGDIDGLTQICAAFDAIDAPPPHTTPTPRTTIVDQMRPVLTQATVAIRAHFDAQPLDSETTRTATAWVADCVVQTAFRIAARMHDHPTETGMCILAVGGYGRAEMAPHSDVDLLILRGDTLTPAMQATVQELLYILWDLKLKIGHAVRSIDECLDLGRADFTIRTSMLELRPLCGEAALADDLHMRLTRDLFAGSEPEFVEAKLAERSERHRKQGGQRYMVEPNVKEGKGGLRDLQSLYWIAKYVHGTPNTSDLVTMGVFTAEEYATFQRAQNFLWAVRCHLHYITGRASDQLTFDMQVEVANRMGYRDRAGRRAVEIFMQTYFRHATAVGDVTRIFLTSLEAQHVKTEPVLQRSMKRRRSAKAPYAISQNRLTVADTDTFLADPVNILRLFEEALRTGTLIHPDAMRLLTANLHLIDDAMRAAPEANKMFLDLLLKHGNPERALRRMNELGVLGTFVPEFSKIVAMMQFNMYHHYTVDEHTIQCISNLHKIEQGDLAEELPISTQAIQNGLNRRVLYVALLLHDIGKGRPEDHSVVGAKITRKLAPRFGLRPKEAKTAEWLVRYHLLMSDMAQKRDLSDPRTVRDFAKAVGTVERLDLLTVLTVCDIRGVGPATWNNWKAQLLRTLYHATRGALENGHKPLDQADREAEAKRALRAALSDWDTKALRLEAKRHYQAYWQGLPTDTHVVFAKMLRDLGPDDIGIDLMPDADHDATRLAFAVADHPGLFSRLAGAVALVGANVVDARTYTSRDGFATAVFWMQDNHGHPFETDRLPRLRQMIHKILMGDVVAAEALEPKDKFKKRERAFRVPTTITFDNDGSERFTIIEVDTRDRPGLLFDLTRTLANANVYISSAVIATYGEQVVDSFYVKDMFGLKFTSDAKQKNLEAKLRDAITRGVDRARR